MTTFFQDWADKNTRSSDQVPLICLGVVLARISMASIMDALPNIKQSRLALAVNQIPNPMPQAYAAVLKLGDGPVGGALGISGMLPL